MSLYCALRAPVNDDDVYHLHSIWLVAQGNLPYKGFFEIHPPGLWLVLSPVAAVFSSPSRYVLTARAATAVILALIVWLAARTVRATWLQEAVLTVLALGIMTRCQIWTFRAEYVAMLLFMLHVYLLAGMNAAAVVRPLFAAAFLGLACTMSIRLLPFLALQPITVLCVAARAPKRQAINWVAGLLLGAAPTIFYLTRHHLWTDMWFWAFRFVASLDVVRWGVEIGRAEMVIACLGMAAAAQVFRGKALPLPGRVVVTAAWVLAFLFHLANPQKVDFAALSLLLTTAILLTALVPLIWTGVSVASRDAAIITVAVGTIFFARLITPVSLPFDRQTQRTQLLVLDWLGEIAGSEPVVLIAPYHPMIARDATDLQNAWYYSFWLDSRAIRERLRSFASTVLDDPPPIIAADPWMEYTGGRDLPAWLNRANVLTPSQLETVRTMLADRYAIVAFPLLAADHGLPFGHQFWVRIDRLATHLPPRPFTVTRGPQVAGNAAPAPTER